MAATIAAVNSHLWFAKSTLVRGVIRIGMTYSVRTNAFHHVEIIPPIQRPIQHVVI